MPEKKKQHYVPKMLLKNFANKNTYFFLYDRDQNIYRDNISYLKQCQKNYFYGNLKDLEDLLSSFENEVSKIFQYLFKKDNDLQSIAYYYNESSDETFTPKPKEKLTKATEKSIKETYQKN